MAIPASQKINKKPPIAAAIESYLEQYPDAIVRLGAQSLQLTFVGLDSSTISENYKEDYK